MFYFCSLGSNMDGQRNIALALEKLAQQLGPLEHTDTIETAPHQLDTPHAFFNALLWFDSPLPKADIKAMFNALETELGRDRTSPNKKREDHPIDIDIMHCGDYLPITRIQIQEPYLQKVQAAYLEQMAMTTPPSSS